MDDDNVKEVLFTCAKYGHLEIIKFLMNNYNYDVCKNILYISAEYGHLEIVKYIIDTYYPRMKHLHKDSALSISVKNGHSEIVSYLIANKADYGYYFNKLLSHSVEIGNFEIIRLLIENDSYNCVLDDDLLWKSVEKGYFDIARFLVKKGCNTSNYISTSISTVWKDNVEIIKFLIEIGIYINLFSYPIITDIIEYNSEKIFNYLLSLYNNDEIIIAINYFGFKEDLTKYLLKKDLSKYSRLVSLYRELGIDLFDLLEKEQ